MAGMDSGRGAQGLWRLRAAARRNCGSVAKMTSNDDLQRGLGRIEGTQAEILKKLDKLGLDLGDHKNEDQKNFSSVRKLVYDHKNDISDTIKQEYAAITQRLETNNAAREGHLVEQDHKLDGLRRDADRAKGAGWVILGLLSALATFVGGSVIAALGGHIRFN